jgi:hypothetical protein
MVDGCAGGEDLPAVGRLPQCKFLLVAPVSQTESHDSFVGGNGRFADNLKRRQFGKKPAEPELAKFFRRPLRAILRRQLGDESLGRVGADGALIVLLKTLPTLQRAVWLGLAFSDPAQSSLAFNSAAQTRTGAAELRSREIHSIWESRWGGKPVRSIHRTLIMVAR